jgi:FixJ family two-component response regulator
MPEREGIETIVALRRAMPTLPIIAVSGGGRFASGADYLQSAGKLGATFTLAKPIDAAQLCDLVDEALE